MTIISHKTVHPICRMNTVWIDTNKLFSIPLDGYDLENRVDELFIPQRQRLFIDNKINWYYTITHHKIGAKIYVVYAFSINGKNYPTLVEMNDITSIGSQWYLNTKVIDQLLECLFIDTDYHDVFDDIVTKIHSAGIDDFPLDSDNRLVQLDLSGWEYDFYGMRTMLEICMSSAAHISPHLLVNRCKRDWNATNNINCLYVNSKNVWELFLQDQNDLKIIHPLDRCSLNTVYSIKMLFMIECTDFSVRCHKDNDDMLFDFKHVTCIGNYIECAKEIKHFLTTLLLNLELYNSSEVIYIYMLNRFELVIGLKDYIIYIPIFLYSIMSFPIIFTQKWS